MTQNIIKFKYAFKNYLNDNFLQLNYGDVIGSGVLGLYKLNITNHEIFNSCIEFLKTLNCINIILNEYNFKFNGSNVIYIYDIDLIIL